LLFSGPTNALENLETEFHCKDVRVFHRGYLYHIEYIKREPGSKIVEFGPISCDDENNIMNVDKYRFSLEHNEFLQKHSLRQLSGIELNVFKALNLIKPKQFSTEASYGYRCRP
jgi:hypothetical protein